MKYYFFLSPFLISAFISLYGILQTGVLGGELYESLLLDFDALDTVFYVAANIIILLALKRYFVYVINSHTNENSCFKVKSKPMILVFTVVVLLNLAFTLITGVGVVLGQETHFLSPLFAALSPVPLFPIVYYLCRVSRGSVLINLIPIVLYCVLRLVQGWTGFLIQIFAIESFIYFSSRRSQSILFKCKCLLIALMLIPAGALLYQTLYPIKMKSRGFDVQAPEYVESLNLVASRLTFIPAALGSIDSIDNISRQTLVEGQSLPEITSILRPLVPSFIMPDKNYKTISNFVILNYFPDIKETTSADLGVVAYLYDLFNVSLIEFIIYCIAMPFLLHFSIILLRVFCPDHKSFCIIFFLLLFSLFYNGTLEFVFGYQIMALFYWALFLFALRVLVLKSNNNRFCSEINK